MRRTLVIVLLFLVACSSESPTDPREPDPPPAESCGPFGDWQASSYVLPYPVGTAYLVNQANCSGFGHSGFWKHGYDFTMAIGTPVTAAREGLVIYTADGAADGDRQRTNLVLVAHTDGTIGLYSHLTAGLEVELGQPVFPGDPIGKSGDTGNTGGLPHLHFSLHPCESLPGLPGNANCPSLPVNFRNTDANPNGLVARRTYPARSY